MSNAIGLGIEIKVKTWFRDDLSTDTSTSFIHNYQICIINKMQSPVQLISREWNVRHLIHGGSHVSGEGVIGKQPILLPNESFEYISGCELISSIGSMKGKFHFKNLDSNTLFEAEIPQFFMFYPPLLN